jgi:hypothetical protein
MTSIAQTKETFFGEGPSRFVVATSDVARLETALGGETFTVTTLGVAGGGELGLGDLAISIEELTSASAAIFAS